MILANVKGQRLILKGDTAVSDSVEYLKICFVTDSEWSGYNKTAVFRDSLGNAYSIALIAGNPLYLGNDTCYIPYEVIKAPHFTVSVFGTRDASVITTPEIKVFVQKSGYGDGAKPDAPTPDEYEQILAAVNDIKLIAQSVRDDADNGAFKGDKGDRGEQGVSGVYVGSGDMPEGYNVQIDPDGETLDMNTLATKEYVDSAVSAVDPQVNLLNYPTKDELADELDPIQQSITDMSVDYIVERGTTDIWTWEKWASGKAVCWANVDMSIGATNVYDGTSSYKEITYPFAFTEYPIVNLNSCSLADKASYGVITCSARNADKSGFALLQNCSNNLNVYVSVYVTGKWN